MFKQADRKMVFPILVFITGLILNYCSADVITGMSGCIWFAPIPLLIYAFKRNAIKPFLMALSVYFFANSVAVLSITHTMPSDIKQYYPTNLFILSNLTTGLIYSLGILLTRQVTLKSKSWLSIFVFPAFWTSYEYINIMTSSAGNNNSIAYTQIHWISLIKISSITGIWGLIFLLTLIPSGLAIAWYLRNDFKKMLLAALIPLVLLTCVVGWGLYEINRNTDNRTIKVGLVSVNQSIDDLVTTNPKKVEGVANRYINAIDKLSIQKPVIVVLPEKILTLKPQYSRQILTLFAKTAKRNHIYLLVGINQETNNAGRNTAYLFSPNGDIIQQYNKQYLITFGPEKNYQPGHTLGTFTINKQTIGVAICHDLDFEELGRAYSRKKIGLLLVPALDFVSDGWLHGRNAIMQGVEGGYSVARAAQWGLLTISNNNGEILRRATTSLTKPVSIMGNVTLGGGNTFYSRFGDWFAWLNIMILLYSIVFITKHQ